MKSNIEELAGTVVNKTAGEMEATAAVETSESSEPAVDTAATTAATTAASAAAIATAAATTAAATAATECQWLTCRKIVNFLEDNNLMVIT